MTTLLAILAVLAVVFGVAVVLTGRAEVLSDEPQDLAATGIPRDRAMTAHDVIGLRFALAFRGYRMSEVDDALDRLAAEIAARDEAIERLRAQTAEPPGYVASDATGDVPSGTPVDEPGEPWPEPGEAAPVPPPLADVVAREDEAQAEPEEPAYVPSDATGDVVPGTPVDVAPADAGEPDGVEPAFVEPPVAEPAPVEPPAAVGAPAEPAAFTAPSVAEVAGSNPYRPEVPEIPTYDPWSVTPRSRYTDGPTYVEVEHADDDEHVADAVTEHQTGYAPPPAPAGDGADERP